LAALYWEDAALYNEALRFGNLFGAKCCDLEAQNLAVEAERDAPLRTLETLSKKNVAI
jgi:hypothetical protein